MLGRREHPTRRKYLKMCPMLLRNCVPGAFLAAAPKAGFRGEMFREGGRGKGEGGKVYLAFHYFKT